MCAGAARRLFNGKPFVLLDIYEERGDCMNVKKIGRTIRYLRRKEGYTQQDLANCLHISFQAVSKWERGICIPDAMYLSKLSEMLNVDLDDLLAGNVTYREDEWEGLILLQDYPDEIYLHGLGQQGDRCLIDIIIGYFMLAGIRNISFRGRISFLDKIAGRFGDGSEWGISLKYGRPSPSGESPVWHTMVVCESVFVYGANLTRFFWRAMSRHSGVSALAVQQKRGLKEYEVSFDRQHLAVPAGDEDGYMLPIQFYPNGYQHMIGSTPGNLIKSGEFFVDPIGKGLTNIVVRSMDDLETVNRFITSVEKMTGEVLYDLDELAEVRMPID